MSNKTFEAMNWCFKCDLVNVGQQRQSACSTDAKFRKRSWHWGWGNPKLFVHLCLMVFPGILWVWLVRTTNFPVHSLSSFLQLRQWTVRGFHSDIASTERAGGHRHIRSNLSCLCVCVCVYRPTSLLMICWIQYSLEITVVIQVVACASTPCKVGESG